jgi:restriction system protein
MPPRKTSPLEGLFDLIFRLSPKLGLVLIALIFMAMRWVFPYFAQPAPGTAPANTLPAKILGTISFGLAPILAGLLLFVWVIGMIRKRLNHQQFDAQTGLDSIRGLSWKQFESLLAAYYERQGYEVEHTGRNGPDGGVDLRLRRDKLTTLVQCKQWKAYDVGVKPLRELQGVVAAQNADRGILVTSGRFTADAHEEFKNNRNIELIDGPRLEAMIREAQSAAPSPATSRAEGEGRGEGKALKVKNAAANSATSPSCPNCQSPMVERTARKGKNIGGKFWGCPRYPKCDGIREMGKMTVTLFTTDTPQY